MNAENISHSNLKITDGCGNVDQWESTVMVAMKAPTPYCVSISTAIMQ
ncbi:MAG: hypothetical protein IPO48_19225 [Saprospiraceae bacterium]|nr:hypothetical protein [Saprospiraceae bacterium]